MVHKVVTTIRNNKAAIYRKALLIGGTFVGIIIAGVLVSKIDDEPDTIIVEETREDDEPTTEG